MRRRWNPQDWHIKAEAEALTPTAADSLLETSPAAVRGEERRPADSLCLYFQPFLLEPLQLGGFSLRFYVSMHKNEECVQRRAPRLWLSLQEICTTCQIVSVWSASSSRRCLARSIPEPQIVIYFSARQETTWVMFPNRSCSLTPNEELDSLKNQSNKKQFAGEKQDDDTSASSSETSRGSTLSPNSNVFKVSSLKYIKLTFILSDLLKQ